ncbi:MAG: PIN domain-containing protein [Candidatus Bathyarchaeia archaeon]
MKKESVKPKVVLDTKPLIKLFAKEEGWETVQKILSKVEDEEIEATISVVTLTEIYYKYLYEKRPDLAKTRAEELRYAIYLKKLEINEEVAIKAGEFKGKYNVSIADAFIAAAAYFEGATILSDDADFKKIPEIKALTEKEFISYFSR